MINYKIFIGTKDGDTKTYLFDTDEYFSKIRRFLRTYHIDGATIYNAVGIWKNTKENSFVVEILNDTNSDVFDSQVMDFIRAIKNALNQNYIMLERQNVDAEFI